MEFTNDNSNINSESYVSNINFKKNNNLKRLSTSNSRSLIKNNVRFDFAFYNYQMIRPKRKNQKNKKKVKFKTNNFVEIIKIQSYKSYNSNNFYSSKDNDKTYRNCDCIIF